MQPYPSSDNGFDPADVEANKGMAIVAYILFFVPLIAAKNSRFAMYHANQGLTLFLAFAICNVVLGILPFIGWFLLPLVNLALFILMVLGIINAAQGRARPLPVIGAYTLIK